MALTPCIAVAAQSVLGRCSLINYRRASSACRSLKFSLHRDVTQTVANQKEILSRTLKKENQHHQSPGKSDDTKTYKELHQMTLDKLQEMEDKISRMATKLEAVSHVSEVQMKLNRANLSYTSGKLVKIPRNRSFRNDLLEAYGYKRLMKVANGKVKTLRCPVIDHPVPASNLIAAHIFKHEWATVCDSVLGLDDVDSPENGLMLFSPIELCFDKLQLCFLWEEAGQEGDCLVCRVLDPGLMNKRLVDVAERRGNWKGSEDEVLQQMRFGDIDGRRLRLMSKHRPMREALNFHARQARLHAISRGWIEESWDFQDFYTDHERWQKMRVWLDQSF